MGRNWSNFANTHTHTHAAKLVVEISTGMFILFF